MVTTFEYFKRVIQDGSVLETRDWYIYAIAIPTLKESEIPQQHLQLYTKRDGIYFIDLIDGEKEYKISDHVEDRPLLTMMDKIKVDDTWMDWIKQPVEVTVGNAILNRLILYGAFNGKVDYYPDRIDIDYINDLLVERVVDDDKVDDHYLSTKEMIDCYDRLTFLQGLSTLINVSATPKTITPPPGLMEAKKKLMDKYGDKILTDGVAAIEFEKKLEEIDREYLADDPAADVVLGKKQRSARKKMYLSYGQAADFNEDTTMIPDSLTEGVQTDADKFPAYMDDLRYGSYSRGGSTAKSGYIYKVLQRSLSSLYIQNTPCDTTRGYKRTIDEDNAIKLVNRLVKVSSGWREVESVDQALKLVGREVTIRSTMYCTAKGNRVCYECLSTFYKDNPSGMSNLAANISDAFMTLFLKRMHASSTEATEIRIEDLTQ